jgi:hypothetical protein
MKFSHTAQEMSVETSCMALAVATKQLARVKTSKLDHGRAMLATISPHSQFTMRFQEEEGSQHFNLIYQVDLLCLKRQHL